MCVCVFLCVCVCVCVAAAGYDETKGFSASLITALVQAGCSGWRRAHALTQEFGTVSPILVIKAAARENAAWVNGASAAEAADAAQNVRLPHSARLCGFLNDLNIVLSSPGLAKLIAVCKGSRCLLRSDPGATQ